MGVCGPGQWSRSPHIIVFEFCTGSVHTATEMSLSLGSNFVLVSCIFLTEMSLSLCTGFVHTPTEISLSLLRILYWFCRTMPLSLSWVDSVLVLSYNAIGMSTHCMPLPYHTVPHSVVVRAEGVEPQDPGSNLSVSVQIFCPLPSSFFFFFFPFPFFLSFPLSSPIGLPRDAPSACYRTSSPPWRKPGFRPCRAHPAMSCPTLHVSCPHLFSKIGSFSMTLDFSMCYHVLLEFGLC